VDSPPGTTTSMKLRRAGTEVFPLRENRAVPSTLSAVASSSANACTLMNPAALGTIPRTPAVSAPSTPIVSLPRFTPTTPYDVRAPDSPRTPAWPFRPSVCPSRPVPIDDSPVTAVPAPAEGTAALLAFRATKVRGTLPSFESTVSLPARFTVARMTGPPSPPRVGSGRPSACATSATIEPTPAPKMVRRVVRCVPDIGRSPGGTGKASRSRASTSRVATQLSTIHAIGVDAEVDATLLRLIRTWPVVALGTADWT
jgi:hypothetical protein